MENPVHQLKMYFLLNMGIFQPAMFVYRRVCSLPREQQVVQHYMDPLVNALKPAGLFLQSFGSVEQKNRTWDGNKQQPRWWFQIFFIFHPYLGKWCILTNIFQMGWNHQPATTKRFFSHWFPWGFFLTRCFWPKNQLYMEFSYETPHTWP